MNKDQVGGIVRAGLTTLAGYMVGKGIIPADIVNDLVAAGLAIFTVAWSFISKKKPAA